MVEIPLTRGMVALVDDADAELVQGWRWQAVPRDKCWYAAARKHVLGSGHKHQRSVHVYMHRLILPGVPRVDHRDGNGLNNQRHNVRPCTNSQNMANSTATLYQ